LQAHSRGVFESEPLQVPDEILSGIGAYWTEHLNRFGIFDVNMEKEMAAIEYDLKNYKKY
jgi:hypothetical protein